MSFYGVLFVVAAIATSISSAEFTGKAVLYSCGNRSDCGGDSCSKTVFSGSCSPIGNGSSQYVRAMCTRFGVRVMKFSDSACGNFEVGAETILKQCTFNEDPHEFQYWDCTESIPSDDDQVVVYSACEAASPQKCQGICQHVEFPENFCFNNQDGTSFTYGCAENGVVVSQYSNSGCIAAGKVTVVPSNVCNLGSNGTGAFISCKARPQEYITEVTCADSTCSSNCSTPWPWPTRQCLPNNGGTSSAMMLCQPFGIEFKIYEDKSCQVPVGLSAFANNMCQMDKKSKKWTKYNCVSSPKALVDANQHLKAVEAVNHFLSMKKDN